MDNTTNEAKSTTAYLIDKTKSIGGSISKNIYSSYKATAKLIESSSKNIVKSI